MTVLNIKNSELIMYSVFMESVSAKGKNARAVAKFIKLLQVKLQEYVEYEQEIVQEYCKKDSNGNLLSQTDIIWETGKEVEGASELAELKSEIIAIDLTEFKPYLPNLITAIEENDSELSGTDLLIFDSLLDKLEEITEGEDK